MNVTQTAKSKSYKQSGVDLEAGDIFNAHAGAVSRASFKNSAFVKVRDYARNHFRGPRGWDYLNLPNGWFNVAAPDGIGTATILISAAEADASSASRLLAMTAGDITRYGGLPLVFVNVLELKTFGEPSRPLFHRYKTMMSGLGEMARDQEYVLMGGETAEMGVCVSSEISGDAEKEMPIYNWSGVMLGVNHPDMLITGEGVQPGDIAVGLSENLGSNGASLCRKYLRKVYGNDWWKHPHADVRHMALPAALYDRFFARIHGWYNGMKPIIPVKAHAHLTGGAFKTKFWDDLLKPLGCSAVLDQLFAPPGFMRDLVDDMKTPDEEAYTVLSAGQRWISIMSPDYVQQFCAEAHVDGILAKPVGYIDKKRRIPRLEITSKFTGKIFTYNK